MKHAKAFLSFAVFAFVCSALTAHSQSAQPAKPATSQQSKPAATQSEPKLGETMTFIQNKLTANSTIGFVASVQNTTDKTTASNTYNVVFTDIHASAPKCSIAFHKKLTRDGESVADLESSTLLKDVQSITVKALPLVLTAESAKAGHPELTTLSTTPKLYLLTFNKYDSGQSSFYFTDLSLAYRVKKAAAHAVQLCGGGKKEPF
jgi:hypothetical protein